VEANQSRIPLDLEKPVSHSNLPSAEPAPAPPSGEVVSSDLEEKIVAALRTCYDPEIPVNIYELGLIYDIVIDPPGTVELRMTLTSPACPAAGSLPPEVQAKVKGVPGVTNAKVEIVWDPPWTPDRMSDAAKLQLGMF
jgi:FeS assembly SUF system protein